MMNENGTCTCTIVLVMKNVGTVFVSYPQDLNVGYVIY